MFTLSEDDILAQVLTETRRELDETESANRMLSSLNFTAIARTPSGGMVSLARKLVTARLAASVIASGILGNFVECGTNTGGTAVVMLKVLAAMAALPTNAPGKEKKCSFWGFDSFMGLPANEDGTLHPVGNEMRQQLGKGVAV